MKSSVPLTVIFTALLIFGSSCRQSVTNTVSDIDGNVYKTVKIGDQWWMAENLRVTKNPEGKPIKGYHYKDDPTIYGKYGMLYTWDTAMDGSLEENAQGIAPDGWHIPSAGDWDELLKTLGGEGIVGEKIKIGGSTGFNAYLTGGADFKGDYVYFDEYAMFWSSTASGEDRAYHMGIDAKNKWDNIDAEKASRIHIRCVKDD